MIITTPRRLMILHLLQRLRTDAETFTPAPSALIRKPPGNAAAGQIVGRQFDAYFVADSDPNVIHPKLAGEVPEHQHSVLKLDLEVRVGQRIAHGPFDFNHIFFGQKPRILVGGWQRCCGLFAGPHPLEQGVRNPTRPVESFRMIWLGPAPCRANEL